MSIHKQDTPDCLHYTNTAIGKGMVVPLCCLIGKRIEVDTLRDLITKQVATKFGSLKIDNCGDTMLYFSDNIQ